MMWLITLNRKLSVSEAGRIYDIVMHNRPANWLDSGQPQQNTLEMQFFFCDALRKVYTKLHTIKELLEAYPRYMYILDRDGVTTSFELALQFANSDIVQYMLELNDDINNYADSTILHWACHRKYDSLKLVKYLLEKQMKLVTNTNRKGELPIHVACDTVNNCSLKYQPEAIEIVWRLLLAYPECLSCVGNSTVIDSKGKGIDDKKNR